MNFLNLRSISPVLFIFISVLTSPGLSVAKSVPQGSETETDIRQMAHNYILPSTDFPLENEEAESEDEQDTVTEKNSDVEDKESAEDEQDTVTEENLDAEEELEAEKPSPEEIARLKKLAIADQLYLGGDKVTAVALYREAKRTWKIEQSKVMPETKEAVFDDPTQLSHGGKVFWRNYQQGKEQQLESKVLSPLKLLTTREPQFLPGHIHYAAALLEYEREAESQAVLDRAVNLYPDEPQILRAKMDADIAAENWLDASIMARQYALFNPDAPEAEEFERLAQEYLAEYQSSLRSNITWNAVGNAIAGTVGFALTGNLFGPLSAIQTTTLLLQGESAVGEASVRQIKKQVPLLKDEAVTEYVNRIGNKITAASGREEFNYEFYVIMDDNLNAFALPGGKIFINAGAIMKTDSEAELAGLLAHEVAHSDLSHGFQIATKGSLTSNIISYIPYVGSTASSLIVLNYSREMERQADIFGTRILVNAGYAADGVRNLMAQLDKSHGEDNPEPVSWMSSHPNSKQRIAYLERLVVEQNLDRYAYEGVYQHQAIKQLVEARWQPYAECIEDVRTIEEAKVCAGEETQEAKLDQESNQAQEESLNQEEELDLEAQTE
ncbi:MAG: M48 family metallopeptidase [Cyanobacteria bacterium J06631_2]